MVTPADRPRTAAVAASADDTRLWGIHLVRAVILGVAAVVITFSRDHSAQLGLLVFGSAALALGAVVGGLSLRLVADRATRRIMIAQSVIAVIAGVVALALQASGLGTFLLVVAIWAAMTGLLELYAGYRLGRRSPLSKDFLIVGAFTAILAIVFVLLPPDFVQSATGKNGEQTTLTSSVIAVGVFGAYAAVVAVYLVIGGLSLKWQKTDAVEEGEQ